jgi:uncharacterized protein YkwD
MWEGDHWAMRPGTALVITLLTAIAAAAFLWPHSPAMKQRDACGLVDQRPSAAGLDAASQATVCLLNRERAARGLRLLSLNALLNRASLEHSREMVDLNYFEHDTPDGRSVGDRLRALGYARGFNASAGENIAWGVGRKSTPRAIVEAWMHSAGHRADILRPAFTEIGIGIALGAPEVTDRKSAQAATYTTDFGGTVDPSLPNG